MFLLRGFIPLLGHKITGHKITGRKIRRSPLLFSAIMTLGLAAATASPPLTAQQLTDSTDQNAHPGDALEVFLITAEPGDVVWELFGHNALVVRDTIRGTEAAYNYGLFDFAAPGFVPRFLQGTMMYMVAPMRVDGMRDSYGAAGRKLWAQKLNLGPGEKLELSSLLATASLPENREYRYEYFLNNCSTKLRDALDQVLNGQIKRGVETQSVPLSTTWRYHTRRLTAPSSWAYLGIDLLLGPKGDEETAAWAEMWVPSQLRSTLAGISIRDGLGGMIPLVAGEELWVDSPRVPELDEPPGFSLLFLLVGGILGSLFIFLAPPVALDRTGSAAVAFAVLAGSWALISAILGVLFIAVHWTDHEFMYWNQNVLLFSPLALGLVVLAPRAGLKRNTGAWTRRLANGILTLSIVALGLSLIPGLGQGNLEWVTLALPANLGLWWALTRSIAPWDRLRNG